MKLPPLIEGRLLKRYKRFLADIQFGSYAETVHCPNPGAMTGLSEPGTRVWCSMSQNPKRKYRKTLEMAEVQGCLVGIHTGRPNAIALEAFEKGKIPELRAWPVIRQEYSWNKETRFDFRLDQNPMEKSGMLVEVKNVHLVRPQGPHPGAAEFPDSITSRGTKHLRELGEASNRGWKATMLYIVQREDVDRFAVASDIDPLYAEAFHEVTCMGVRVLAWSCRVTLEKIELQRELPVEVD